MNVTPASSLRGDAPTAEDLDLSRFPGYRPGSPPQYAEYHAEVDFLDEMEAI
ncbi:hypothetical protein [Geodermatophilus sp. DF01-2]|uniref:hypothetical protein n=1 Tax=Geodermatophilus sp. DF01-2 TaxID=2559610 RepID=UPI001431718A|nr:hypothetical protein [Geodermatophilus sp. DF01_2]